MYTGPHADYRNMEKSLAQELREATKELRAQEKRHFDLIKAYEKSTTNAAIELSETQK
jgi:rubrerythrin